VAQEGGGHGVRSAQEGRKEIGWRVIDGGGSTAGTRAGKGSSR
jgi:hypothetical protein